MYIKNQQHKQKQVTDNLTAAVGLYTVSFLQATLCDSTPQDEKDTH